MSIQENIAEIRRRIAVACAECGRDQIGRAHV